MAAMPTVVIDATMIEAIVYNIATTAQIQHSISKPADVSLLFPSSDPLLMKDTKTEAVPTIVVVVSRHMPEIGLRRGHRALVAPEAVDA